MSSASLTLKDVLCWLELDGDELVRTPGGPGGKSTWTLQRAGREVSPDIAAKACANPSVTLVNEARNGECRYAWRGAAA